MTKVDFDRHINERLVLLRHDVANTIVEKIIH